MPKVQNCKVAINFKLCELVYSLSNPWGYTAAEKTHIREQKLNLEITAAKKQRDHYLSNAEKSRTQKFIKERIKKV